MNKLIPIWKRYGHYIAIAVLGIILITVVAVLIGKLSHKSSKTTESIIDGIIVNEATESYTYDYSSVSLKHNAYTEINELAENYLNALLTGDVDTLNNIIQSETKLTEGSVSSTGDYVEEYQNIECYTLDGMEDNTYVVYIVYDEKLIGIETAAPSMIRLYVCRDSSTDNVYIYNGTFDGELKTYMELADSNEDVCILKAKVNQAFEDACLADAELAEVYARLQQAVNTSSSSDDDSE